MREAAATVREAGLEPLMTAAIAERQQWLADLARAGVFRDAAGEEPWRQVVERITRDAPARAAPVVAAEPARGAEVDGTSAHASAVRPGDRAGSSGRAAR
jgi:hypothetical protein